MNYVRVSNFNDEPVWAIQSNGFTIYDPFSSECGRFSVSPSYYGLTDEQANQLIAKNESDGFDWKC